MDWDNLPLQIQIMSALHAAPAGGLFGFFIIYRRSKQLFAWKNVKNVVKEYVSQCQICQ
jgi:hypothetical protein